MFLTAPLARPLGKMSLAARSFITLNLHPMIYLYIFIFLGFIAAAWWLFDRLLRGMAEEVKEMNEVDYHNS